MALQGMADLFVTSHKTISFGERQFNLDLDGRYVFQLMIKRLNNWFAAMEMAVGTDTFGGIFNNTYNA